MMQYDGDLKLPARFLVPPPAIHGVSGKLLADAGVTTFACSETQKFGHVRLGPTLRMLNRSCAAHHYNSIGTARTCDFICELFMLASVLPQRASRA